VLQGVMAAIPTQPMQRSTVQSPAVMAPYALPLVRRVSLVARLPVVARMVGGKSMASATLRSTGKHSQSRLTQHSHHCLLKRSTMFPFLTLMQWI
jgi:hypothetical protein